MTAAHASLPDERLVTADRFIAFVTTVIKRPGPRAVLRRALGKPATDPSVHGAYTYVAPWLPGHASQSTTQAYFTVAALIAAQPRTARDAEDDEEQEPGEAKRPDPISLGHTMGTAVALDKLAENTTTARLHLLCRQDQDGLRRHLPRLVAHLRADLVPVDWGRLLIDLTDWPRRRAGITARWLTDYHRIVYRAEQQTSKTTESE